jgi:hypothetical protein
VRMGSIDKRPLTLCRSNRQEQFGVPKPSERNRRSRPLKKGMHRDHTKKVTTTLLENALPGASSSELHDWPLLSSFQLS